MPVVYHNIQYPYSNLEKFKKRSHNFVAFGLVQAGITLYSRTLIRFEVRNKLGMLFASYIDYLSVFLAFIPFAIAYIAFKERKRQWLN